MKVLVTGARGMLGRDLVEELDSRGHEAVATDLPELDISDPVAVALINASNLAEGCSWCINCAAFTAVDRAEAEPELAQLANALGPGYLAAACRMRAMRLVQISTDFVYDGTKREPYVEDDPTQPLGVYGASKLGGEEAVRHHLPDAIIARTAWLFGPYGENFPRTMIRAFLTGKLLRVVDDQVGTPTYTRDLARVLVDMVELDAPGGVYHTAGPEALTRHAFAFEAVTAFRDVVLKDARPIEIGLAKSSDFPTPARRPAYSALSFEKVRALGIEPMRAPSMALADFCRRLGERP